MASRNLTNKYMEIRRAFKLLGSDHVRIDANENKFSDGLLQVFSLLFFIPSEKVLFFVLFLADIGRTIKLGTTKANAASYVGRQIWRYRANDGRY
jgi:hypothetical protein